MKPKRVTLWTIAYAYGPKARLVPVEGTMTATRITLDDRIFEFGHARRVAIDAYPYTPEDAIAQESERLDRLESEARKALRQVEKRRAALATLQGATGMLALLEGPPETPQSPTDPEATP